MSVKISSKYQVVIPEKARKQLDLKPGTEVDVIVKGKIAYIVPVPTLKSLQKDLKEKISYEKVREKKDRDV